VLELLRSVDEVERRRYKEIRKVEKRINRKKRE